MSRSIRWWLASLVVWTVFVWGNRLVNAWTSTTEATSAKVGSTLLAGIFLVFAALTAWIAWRGALGASAEVGQAGHRPLDRSGALVLQAFALWTVSVWVVRVGAIALADHSVGFKVVHAALGVVSILLAVPAWRVGSRRWSSEVVAG